MTQRLLVTGSTGMLGKDVVHELSAHKEFSIYGISRSAIATSSAKVSQIVIDATRLFDLEECLKEIKPAVIIHCAANTDIEDCEARENAATKINVNVTRVLAEHDIFHCRMIYISTDSVFDGSSGYYRENDLPKPLNKYAKSKLLGENAVLEANPSHLVLRTNIYGFHSVPGRSLVEWALSSWERGETIRGFKDAYFNPLYTRQLARVIVRLLRAPEVKGILNVGCKQILSKYDFLEMLAIAFGFPTSRIIPALADDNQVEQIRRPRNTSLVVDLLGDLIGEVPDLCEGIAELRNDLQVRG